MQPEEKPNTRDVAVEVGEDLSQVITPPDDFKQAVKSVALYGLTFALIRGFAAFGDTLCSRLLLYIDKDTADASSVITSAYIVLINLAGATIFSTGIKIAQQPKKLNEIYQASMLQGVVVSSAVALPICFLSASFLNVLGIDPQISAIFQDYLRGLSPSIMFSLWLGTLQQMVLSVRKPKSWLAGLMYYSPYLAYGLGVLLQWLGRLGPISYNAFGLGMTYSLAYLLSFIVFRLSLFFDKQFKQLSLFKKENECWLHFKDLIKVGLPIGIQIGSEIIGIFFLTTLINPLGVNDSEAIEVNMGLLNPVILMVFAQAHVAGILVSKAVRAGKFNYVRLLNYAAQLLNFGLSSLLFIGFMFFPKALMSVFIDVNDPHNQNVMELTRAAFFVNGFVQFIDSIRNTAVGILRAFKDTVIAMCTGAGIVGGLGYLFAWAIGNSFESRHWMELSGICVGRGTGILLAAVTITSYCMFRWVLSDERMQKFREEQTNGVPSPESTPEQPSRAVSINHGENKSSCWSRFFPKKPEEMPLLPAKKGWCSQCAIQ